MRVVIQRVSRASVTVDGTVTGAIQTGLLVLAGFTENDTEEDFKWMASKICQLRIFPDENGVMNISLTDAAGDLLLVSQFTLHASTKKGNRPSYIRAAKPDLAKSLYHQFHQILQSTLGKSVPTGIFGADMKVDLLNDGPVTIVIDTENKE